MKKVCALHMFMLTTQGINEDASTLPVHTASSGLTLDTACHNIGRLRAIQYNFRNIHKSIKTMLITLKEKNRIRSRVLILSFSVEFKITARIVYRTHQDWNILCTLESLSTAAYFPMLK